MAMMTQITPTAEDNEPSLPRGTIRIGANPVTQPGAANLWTGDNACLDLMSDLDNGLPDLIPPEKPDTGLINHGQSNPEQLVEPDPRQAFQEAHAEQIPIRGCRNIPVYYQMETPTNSRAESAWGTPDSQT